MAPFDFLAPATVDDALDVLAEHGEEAKVLAGGQSLIPLLNYRLARPRWVVDINGLPLTGVRVERGHLRLGALTRHVDLEESAEVRRRCPILTEAAALIGNVRVRTLGTVGGSLAHADPAAELPLTMLAVDAHIHLAGRDGRRAVPASQFFRGPLTTALGPGELVTEIVVPVMTGGWAIEELSRRVGDFAIVAVAAIVSVDRRGHVDDARLAACGVGPTPLRVALAEEALHGREPTEERIAHAAQAVRLLARPESDAFVSGAYRQHCAGVLARRALTRAVARAMEAR